MTAQQINFVKNSLQAAVSAGASFNMNPTMILAQAAFESGWGMSKLATGSNNYFGLTAYGCSNQYWHGGKTTVNTGSYSLDFRRYDTRENSFLDFARLIHSAYPVAATLTFHPTAYAKEIAYSKYISEVNGDNRAAYQRMLVSICRTIERMIVN